MDAGHAEDIREPIDRTAVKQVLQPLQRKHDNNLTTQALMEAQSLEPFVVGEADAKMMRTYLGPRAAYNVHTAVDSRQSTVDSERCLILHHAVTDTGTDNQQLEPMATVAKAVLEQGALNATADAGYSNGEHFQSCEDANITAYLPPNRATNT